MTTEALMNTYGARAATLIRGEGAWLWDDKGNKYLDGLSGIAVCGLGHSHPKIAAAVAQQATELTHCSNFFAIPNQQALASKLCDVSGMSNVFFGNSGAEANEAAIKMARLYGNKLGIKLPTILVMDNAFHGRTLATLTASGSRKVQAGFEPLVRGFARGPFNEIEALKTIGDNNPDICAVFVEPIQGEGGIRVADDDYLQQLRALCDQRGWLLMLDEVQTGNGRTGSYLRVPVTCGISSRRGHHRQGPGQRRTHWRSVLASGAGRQRAWAARSSTAPPSAATHWPAPLHWLQLLKLSMAVWINERQNWATEL